MNILPDTYTKFQTGAIATLLAASLRGLTDIGVFTTEYVSMPASILTFVTIVTIVAWLLVPLYAKRIRWSYIVGIVLTVIALVPMFVPDPSRWYMFTVPVYNFSQLVFILIMLAGIYFAYKSYQELKK